MSPFDLLDIDTVSLFVDMGADVAGSLIDLYIDHSLQQVEKLRQQLDLGDADAACKTAHSLKGSSLNTGAKAMGETCLQIEILIKDNHLSQAAGVAETLPDLLSKTRQALINFLKN